MKSPFPGMDPWLEEHWRDIHHSFLTYARDDMQSQLPGQLRARLEERVCIEPDVGQLQSIYPDVRIVEYPGRKSGASAESAGGVAVCEPMVIQYDADDEHTEGYIEVIDTGSGNQVVTVIELLSV